MENLIEEPALIEDDIAFELVHETTVEALRLLAEQGDADAQTALGCLYAIGRGVPQDDSEAAKWFRLAAEGGDPVGQSSLGARTLTGEVSLKTTAKRSSGFGLPLNKGMRRRSNLAIAYARGRGVLKTTAKRRSGFGLPLNKELRGHRATSQSRTLTGKVYLKTTAKRRSGIGLPLKEEIQLGSSTSGWRTLTGKASLKTTAKR